MFEGAIFDMDGLMFDTEPIWTETWAPVLATVGKDYPHGLANAIRGTSGKSMKPGLDELLAYLKSEGVPMAVASSSSLEAIRMNLANGGVADYFSELFTGVGMAHPKPEPDIFLKTAEAMGVDPARTLVLEDSLSGVRAGVAGGFITIMVPDLIAPDDFAKENASLICSSLLEVRDQLAAGRLG